MDKIAVTFNSSEGLARHPIRHTCSGTHELSSTYKTFPEFEAEFHSILSLPDNSWTRDSF